ncbi:hypothetical protein OAS88_00915 [Planktomarina temperata]|nr:hypothetical protein [Planktomarina temperata]MDC1094165.1 hypothetical protein [Planktomarina temperata]
MTMQNTERKVYLFIGPQRSSTTSLYHSLRASNDISFMDEKENNYWQNPAASFSEYITLFTNSDQVLAVDICPQYFADVSTLLRIAREQNNFHKVIFLHRNPIDRAKSFLKLQQAYGRDVFRLIHDEQFLLNFICYKNLNLCFRIFRPDKFQIIDVTNLNYYITQEFGIPNFTLAHVHKSFGRARFEKFNKYALPLILRFLRSFLELNRLVDWLKEHNLVRGFLFKNDKDFVQKEIDDVIDCLYDDLLKEVTIVKNYFDS